MVSAETVRRIRKQTGCNMESCKAFAPIVEALEKENAELRDNTLKSIATTVKDIEATAIANYVYENYSKIKAEGIREMVKELDLMSYFNYAPNHEAMICMDVCAKAFNHYADKLERINETKQ